MATSDLDYCDLQTSGVWGRRRWRQQRVVGSDADVFVVRRTRNEQRGGRRMKGVKRVRKK